MNANVWDKLKTLEPDISEKVWESVLEKTSSPVDERTPSTGTYHDAPRPLEPFPEKYNFKDAKRIKTGIPEEDVELLLFERTAAVLACADTQGVVLSAPSVLRVLAKTSSN